MRITARVPGSRLRIRIASPRMRIRTSALGITDNQAKPQPAKPTKYKPKGRGHADNKAKNIYPIKGDIVGATRTAPGNQQSSPI